MSFKVGQTVRFAGLDSVVQRVDQRDGATVYLLDHGASHLPMSVPEDILVAHQKRDASSGVFTQRTPHMIIVDEFLHDPVEVRALALAQEYHSNLQYFKGLRSTQRFLWPGLREEFGRLLGTPVTRWLEHDANGCFQQTEHTDPLVWHHDSQEYAAALYLTPNAPLGSGTSFWRDRTSGCRRAPLHPLEQKRLGTPEAIGAAEASVYDAYNIEHRDNWELVDSVAAVYNRLVIWDAKLIHSAASYEGFARDGDSSTRLVQLFFFDAS